MSYRVRHPDMHQEEDVVHRKGVYAFLGIVFVVSAVLIVWTVSLLNQQWRELRPSGAFTEEFLGPRHQVARVRQDLFDEQRPERSLNAMKRQELGSYGWVDRRRGVVRIPIEKAMDLVAEGKRP
ncbi:Hypothetical protein A7982_01673 [Minicystis rosea]|nr:Hypothetical protein A7982_01673 [Minicystis rosea]